jgi:hypothetical protein
MTEALCKVWAFASGGARPAMGTALRRGVWLAQLMTDSMANAARAWDKAGAGCLTSMNRCVVL